MTTAAIPKTDPELAVVLIHGVGNPASGYLLTAVQRVFPTWPAGVAPQSVMREFNWNAFATHRPGANRLSRYALHFSRTFANAAWVRRADETFAERVSLQLTAVAHVVAALSIGILIALAFVVMVLTAARYAATYGDVFGGFSGIANTGLAPLPEAIAARLATWLEALHHTLSRVAGTGAWTAGVACLASLAFAIAAALSSRSGDPVRGYIRRMMLLSGLIPGVLLSGALLGTTSERDAKPSTKPSSTAESVDASFGGLLQVASFASWLVFGAVTGSWEWLRSLPISAAILAVIALTITAAAAALALLGEAWLPGAKVLLDVALYVSSRGYRRRLQAQLAMLITSLRDEHPHRHFVLVAHSLGSVIALDSLVSSDAWLSSDRVTLITFGSPITRLFGRFYPGLLFPKSAGDAASLVASRVKRFQWINVYRPLDWIGGALDLEEPAQNVSTRQWTRGHTGYWDDAEVWEHLGRHFDGLDPITPARTAEKHPPSWTWDAPTWTKRFGSAVEAAGVRRTFVVAPVAIALVLPSVGRQASWPQPASGRVAVAEVPVTHRREFTRSTRHHIFSFELGDHGKVDVRVLGTWGVLSDPRFEYLPLARAIRERCPGWFWSKPCTHGAIRVRYSLEDRRLLEAIDYPAHRSRFRSALRWWFAILWGVFAAFAITMVGRGGVGLGVAATRLLLGRPRAGGAYGTAAAGAQDVGSAHL